MDIKLKYKAWVGEKHADISHKLMGNDIETFALEFAEHIVKNCSIPDVVERSELFTLEQMRQSFDAGAWEHHIHTFESWVKTLK